MRFGLSKWSKGLPWIILTVSLSISVLAGKAFSSEAPIIVNYLVVEEKTQPFQIVSEEGHSRGGIISDIVEAVFEGPAFAVKHHVMPVNRVQQSVADLKVHHWISFGSPVWTSFGEMGERVGVPLFETRHVLMTCSPDVPSEIDSVDDLAGLSIVTLRHFDYLGLNEAVEEGLVRLIPVDRYTAGLELVRVGSVDGFIEMVSRLRYQRTQLEGDHSCIREVDASAIIPNYPIHLYLDRRWPTTVKQFIAKRLEEMAAAGELEQIFNRYVLTEAIWQSSVQ